MKETSLEPTQHPQPGVIIPAIMSAFVSFLISMTFNVAFARLLFSGTLESYFVLGLSFFLMGGVITAVWIALASSVRGSVSVIQDSASGILVAVAVTIVAQIEAATLNSEAAFWTVMASVMLASLLMGLSAWLLGHFRLGNLIRYVPLPVVGGFLAGSGMLLARGSLSILTGSQITNPDLFQPQRLAIWLPGVVLGILLLIITRMPRAHYLAIPGLLVVFTLLYHAGLWVAHISLPQAVQLHLLSEFSSAGDGLWVPINYTGLTFVDWKILGAQLGSIFVAMLMGLIAMLLNLSSAEAVLGEDVNLNHELKTSGYNNLFMALVGSPISYHALSLVALARRLGAHTRLVGVFVGLLFAIVMFFGGGLISLMPTALLGAMLLFLGLDFLSTWLVETWAKLPRSDYFIIVAITLTIVVVGVLEGMAIGLLLAVLLFVVQYTRTGVIRHQFDGAGYESSTGQPAAYRAHLRQQPSWLAAIELQGFIFFGTAYTLLEKVQKRIEEGKQATRFLVLDFRYVTGIDVSAMQAFRKILQQVEGSGMALALTHVGEPLRLPLKELLAQTSENCRQFERMGDGIAWCEKEMIADLFASGALKPLDSFKEQMEQKMPADCIPDLMQYMAQQQLAVGDILIRQNEQTKGFYFIETGQLMVQVENSDGETLRLRSLGSGTVVGEISHYLQTLATANVVAEEESIVYGLTRENLLRMEKENPVLALAFHRFLASLLSEKLIEQGNILQGMLD